MAKRKTPPGGITGGTTAKLAPMTRPPQAAPLPLGGGSPPASSASAAPPLSVPREAETFAPPAAPNVRAAEPAADPTRPAESLAKPGAESPSPQPPADAKTLDAKPAAAASATAGKRARRASQGPPSPMTSEDLRRVAEEISREYAPEAAPARVGLLPIDPYWVHAYWDLPKEMIAAAREELGRRGKGSRLVLRVHDASDPNTPAGSKHFDLDVSGESRNWYFNLWSLHGALVSELGLRAPDGTFHALARSNRADIPRAGPSPITEPRFARVGPEGSLEPTENPQPVAAESSREARERALVALARAGAQEEERQRLVALMERGGAQESRIAAGAGQEASAPPGPREAAPEPSRAALIEVEKARRDWPAWMRALTEGEVEAFYGQLLAMGRAPAPPPPGAAAQVALEDEPARAADLARALGTGSFEGAERHLIAFIEAARKSGAPLSPLSLQALRGLIEAALRTRDADLLIALQDPFRFEGMAQAGSLHWQLSPGSAAPKPTQGPGGQDVFLEVETELILYGRTIPGSNVRIADNEVPLRPDGSFSTRMALPEGVHRLPVRAVFPDGRGSRSIVPVVVRSTEDA